MAARSRAFYTRFSSPEELQHYDNMRTELPRCESLPVPTFKVSLYRSGEISAAYYLANSPRKFTPIPRAASVTTDRLTFKSVQKIRRATECSRSEWKSFVTLTFNSKGYELDKDGNQISTKPCLLDENGTVSHEWAKKELIRFRQALSKKVSRQIDCKINELPEFQREDYRRNNAFRYIWVCELQKNGNIHFHIMFNKYFAASYLRKLWGQGSCAVDVRKVSDSRHAAAYICKYITKEADGRPKEDSTIKGNRYNISRAAREDAMPSQYHRFDKEAKASKDLLDLMKEMVDQRGGKVIDSGFGMNIPAPRRSVPYRDKKTGTIKKTKGVDSRLGPAFMDVTFGAVPF